MKSKVLCLVLVLVLCVLQAGAFADTASEIVSLGGNLKEAEQTQILNTFGVNKNDVQLIKVTIDEERKYLGGKLPDSVIGNQSISSAYIKILDKGSGIEVKTEKITKITVPMYTNAIVTAGIEDAYIHVAAPYPVSGTGALTGIMKAFEKMTGKEIPEENKEVANEEMVVTSELGDDVGKEEAANLITAVKEKIIEENAKSPEDIKKIIIDVSGDLNINLTSKQIDQLVSLMEKISKLNLDLDSLKKQVGEFSSKVNKTLEENKGTIKKIWDVIVAIFSWIGNFISEWLK